MGMWDMGAPDIPPKKSWGIPTPQYPTHIRHQYGWGERPIHHKWYIKEEIIRYTQHLKIYCNTTANLYWKSGTQLWRPSSNQNSHYMVQPQEPTWRCTTHKQKKSSFTTFEWSYQDWEKLERSKQGRTLPLMTDTYQLTDRSESW